MRFAVVGKLVNNTDVAVKKKKKIVSYAHLA